MAWWRRDEKVLPASGIVVFDKENRRETRSTQRTLPSECPTRIHVAFDDHRLVASAGLILPAALAHHLGLGRAGGPLRWPGRCAGSSERGGQATDPGGVCRWPVETASPPRCVLAVPIVCWAAW